MKLLKMSFAAALLLGANAFAIENVKVDGTASLFYHTQDTSVKNGVNVPDIFNKDASMADSALRLGVSADLTPNFSAGATLYGVSTLGLENNLVSGVWSGAHGVSANAGASFGGGVEVDSTGWLGEAWIAGTLGKTTAKVGRMELDTPLAFTETWNIAPNTFEAAVLLNQDIPDTTIVAAWVGKHNGAQEFSGSTLPNIGLGVLSAKAKFHTFATDGAYAFGVVNNSWKPLTVQAWYYDLQKLAKAYWLQADLNLNGILAGVQYGNVDLSIANTKVTDGYALMLGYEMKDVFTVKGAYSSVADDGSFNLNNTATGGQSKLYTELWWNFAAGNAGNDTYALTVEGTLATVDLFLGGYYVDVDPVGKIIGDNDSITEVTLTAGRDFGPINTTLALIYDEFDYDTVTPIGAIEDSIAFQVYLTYNF